MWLQQVNPVHNLVLATIIAVSPILLLAGLLLSRKVAGYVACIITLCYALLLAIFVYGMPAKLAGLSGLYGMLCGLMPIGWIVLAAVFLYNISVASGSFAVIRKSIEHITVDRRIQALLIAFCFGAFLEGSAGFGAPVAITAGMLIGLGFTPIYAASICLLANTAPVAFGGIGIAVVTAGQLTNLSPDVLSRMIGHQLPFIALIIPLWLVIIIAGWKGAKAIWPAIVTCGVAYASTMFLSASYLGPALPDILSAIVSLIALIVLLRFWQPKEVWRFPNERHIGTSESKVTYTRSQIIRAWTPFLVLIVFVINWAFSGTQSLLGKLTLKIPFGALNEGISANGHIISVNYSFAWMAAAGTGIALAAILSAILMQMPFRQIMTVAWQTLVELKRPLITIAAIVGFAYVANFSGITATISLALASTGHFFPLVSPLLGWIGVFITGSDTSSNALFGGVQYNTATSLGISPVLTVASNSSGGVAAKMISPQSIAVAAAATKLVNQEGKLFRRVVPHSIAIVAIICLIAYVQAYYLPWMIPPASPFTTLSHAVFNAADFVVVGLSIVAIVVLAVIARRTRPASLNTSA